MVQDAMRDLSDEALEFARKNTKVPWARTLADDEARLRRYLAGQATAEHARTCMSVLPDFAGRDCNCTPSMVEAERRG